MQQIFKTAIAASFSLMLALEAQAQAQNEDTFRQLELFGDVFERVRAAYVDQVGDDVLIEAAINGMLNDLDPHSAYLNKKTYEDMQVQIRGDFGGLGIEVTMEQGLVKVVSPIDDTPAHQAGLKPGDYISHLDGEGVMGMNLAQAVEKMRGPVNTDIVLTISREGQEPFDVTLTRAVIQIQSVRSRVEKNIGYIRITSFNEQTQPGLKRAIAKITEELGDEVAGYIIDLRNNPGGLLSQAVKVSDSFLERGEIVSTRGRQEGEASRFNAESGDMVSGLPLVVLINGGSASASEIVAGALQDHRRALVVGTRSFGKGSVQTIMPIPGAGAMRLTTARYYTPSGRSIQQTGIEPDIEVEQVRLEPLESRERMREADLRNALTNDERTSEEARTPGQAVVANDYQLTRAIDLLRGISFYGVRVE